MTSYTPEEIDELPGARTQAGPPATGRRMWLCVVTRCPHCQGFHGHRALDEERLFSGRAVRKCPVTLRDYALRPVHRHRNPDRRKSTKKNL